MTNKKDGAETGGFDQLIVGERELSRVLGLKRGDVFRNDTSEPVKVILSGMGEVSVDPGHVIVLQQKGVSFVDKVVLLVELDGAAPVVLRATEGLVASDA